MARKGAKGRGRGGRSPRTPAGRGAERGAGTTQTIEPRRSNRKRAAEEPQPQPDTLQQDLNLLENEFYEDEEEEDEQHPATRYEEQGRGAAMQIDLTRRREANRAETADIANMALAKAEGALHKVDSLLEENKEQKLLIDSLQSQLDEAKKNSKAMMPATEMIEQDLTGRMMKTFLAAFEPAMDGARKLATLVATFSQVNDDRLKKIGRRMESALQDSATACRLLAAALSLVI